MRVGFEDWQDALMSVLPGASRANVEMVFWNVARDFYLRSRSWREQLGAFTLREGQIEIPLEPVDQTGSICFLESVYLEGAPVFMNVGHSTAFFLEGQYTPGTPNRFELVDPHTVICTPAPNRDFERALWLLVSVQPSRNGGALPAYALTHHFKGLEEGTLGKMLVQANKPWSDVNNGMVYQRRYEVEIARARANAEKGYGKSAARWTHNQVSLR